jgi:hypothetical protein
MRSSLADGLQKEGRGGEDGRRRGVEVEVVDGGERRNVVVLSKWSE